MNKNICQHTITGQGEDALPYCSICAPKEIFALRNENEKLIKSLEAAHFTDEGGELWKPPVRNVGVFERLETINTQLREIIDEYKEMENWLRFHDWKQLRAIKGELQYGGGFTIYDSRTEENIEFSNTILEAFRSGKNNK